MIQQIQTSKWSDRVSSITETRMTLESVSDISVDMEGLVSFLYSKGDTLDVMDLPELGQLRANFSDTLFHTINVETENPYAYRVTDYDLRTRMDNFKDYTGLVIGDWDNELAKDAVAYAYNAPARSSTPRFALVEKSYLGDSRRYIHLVWPLSENGKVTQILVGASYKNFAIDPRIFDSSVKVGPYEISRSPIRRWWKKLTPVETQLGAGVSINAKRKSIAMKVGKIMANGVIDAVIN